MQGSVLWSGLVGAAWAVKGHGVKGRLKHVGVHGGQCIDINVYLGKESMALCPGDSGAEGFIMWDGRRDEGQSGLGHSLMCVTVGTEVGSDA